MNNKFLGNNKLSLAPIKLSRQTRDKRKVLVWSDCVLASTGFGTVSKHILRALHETGEYEIDQLAINSIGEFYDTKAVPYCIMPARLNNPDDPYGSQMFVTALQRKQYDIVLVINDTFVVEEVAQKIEQIRKVKQQRGEKPFALVYYYPVDCRLLPQVSTMVKIADRSVAYTNFAKQSSKAIGVTPTDVIYHGTDVKSFHPIDPQARQAGRKRWYGVKNNEKFVFINVNRNSARKDIARTILAFSEFRKKVPNSLLYVHAKIEDGVGGHPVDLRVPVAELGLDITKDVIFPNRFSAARGFPIEILNNLYCCADAYISTHLGEGWGLTITEAMACGVPVIAPNNTTAPEILGVDRGYVYKCKEKIYVDNSGYRPMGRLDDIIDQMMLCYDDWKNERPRRQEIIDRARAFVHENSWDNICKKWVRLFKELDPAAAQLKAMTEGEEL